MLWIDRVDYRPSIPAPSRRGSAVGITTDVLEHIFPDTSQRDFTVNLWDEEILLAGPGQPERFSIRLNHPGALRQMFWPPSELNLTEAYMNKAFDIYGNRTASVYLIEFIEQKIADPRNWFYLASLGRLPKMETTVQGRGSVQLEGKVHSQDRDRKAVTSHYDLSNEFYRRLLSRRMLYSCAYFPTKDMTLDQADEAKLKLISRKLQLEPGDRLLDIGCGWGGLIIYAASECGVDATGITLSEPQAELANERIKEDGLTDRCRAVVCDYREIEKVKPPFNKIVSVGMVEHVGKAKMPEYFDIVYESLTEQGLFLNHGIGIGNGKLPDFGFFGNLVQKSLSARGTFIKNHIFPDGELMYIDELLALARKAGFGVRHVENLGEHYAKTLRCWGQNLEDNWEEAKRLVDERICRAWRLYIAGSEDAFIRGRLGVFQSLLVKTGADGKSSMPLTSPFS